MLETKIKLDNVDKVIRFVNLAEKIDADMNVICGSIVLDARSFLGILNLDLGKLCRLQIIADEKKHQGILSELKEYIVA